MKGWRLGILSVVGKIIVCLTSDGTMTQYESYELYLLVKYIHAMNKRANIFCVSGKGEMVVGKFFLQLYI